MPKFPAACNRLQGVIFDCDGVLVASKEANKQYYNLILKRLGLPPMTSEQEDYMHMHTVDESIQYLVPEQMLAKAQEVRGMVSYEDIVSYVQIEQGLVEFLDLLYDSGIRCAVNTNRSNTMGLILQRFALEKYFHPVVTAATVQNPKPDPESLYLILRHWNSEPQEIVFIGDSVVDEQTARSAGVPFWAYKNNLLQADLHINSYAQLKSLLEKEYLVDYAQNKIA
jgi:HAD superfamily hydrolase (TIGR01549 family)